MTDGISGPKGLATPRLPQPVESAPPARVAARLPPPAGESFEKVATGRLQELLGGPRVPAAQDAEPRVDLGSTSSKYIGETEKNLSSVFDRADKGDVTLHFDEADALFGKRTDVKDAHDRFATDGVSSDDAVAERRGAGDDD